MATTVLTGRIIRSGSIPATALGGGVISSSTSFATTGSNSFTGNQNINGTVYLTGSLIPSGNFFNNWLSAIFYFNLAFLFYFKKLND